MITISINSIKGGTGKSTLSVVLLNALVSAGYRCLAIDADASNNSMSFHLYENPEFEMIKQKNIFNVFVGGTISDNVIKISDCIDLLHGDVRLNEFRSTDSLKRLKRSLKGLAYDFVIIDTSPTYDNIIGNVLTASDILLIPVLQDMFSYQALRYQFDKLADLELNELDTHIIFNQFEKPRTDNQDAYRNQITNIVLNDDMFKNFINPNRISRSSVFRKYINKQHYQIDYKAETEKYYEEIKNLINSILGISIKEAI
ncbi:cobyric acid synthase [Spirochaetia bacterium]|nr:cobyric acid synthase [Spirochaetia bacterium]